MTTLEILHTTWEGDTLVMHVAGPDESSFTVIAEYVWGPYYREYDVVLSPHEREHAAELTEHASVAREQWLRKRI
jgi:hypothetical protein